MHSTFFLLKQEENDQEIAGNIPEKSSHFFLSLRKPTTAGQ